MNALVISGILLSLLGFYFDYEILKFGSGILILIALWWREKENILEGSPKKYFLLCATAFILSGLIVYLPALILLAAFYFSAFNIHMKVKKIFADKKRIFDSTEDEIREAEKERKEVDRIEEESRHSLKDAEDKSRLLRLILEVSEVDEVVKTLHKVFTELKQLKGIKLICFRREDEISVNEDVEPWVSKFIQPFLGQARLVLLKTMRMETLKKVSRSDWLTGLPNRRALDENVESEKHRAVALGLSLSYLMLDIDYFKKFNDNYGHAVGDFVLVEIAKVINETARKTDSVARYGGEEFCVLLAETGIEPAMIFAERLRKRIEDMPLLPPGHSSPLRVTVSIGVSERSLASADEALYLSKQNGRNRVSVIRDN